MADQTSSLTIRLGLTGVSGVLQGFKQISAGILGSLGGPLAGIGSIAGLTGLVKGGIEFADQMGKVAEVVGVNARQMAGLTFAAGQSEVGIDQLKMVLRTFAEQLVKTGRGSENLRDALLAESKIFAALPDGASKAALAVERFGRAGLTMIPFLNQGPEKLAELIDRGEVLSGITDDMVKSAEEFTQAMNSLEFAAKGLAATLALPLIKNLTTLAESITNLIPKYDEWMKKHETVRKMLVLAQLNPFTDPLKYYKTMVQLATTGTADIFNTATPPAAAPKAKPAGGWTSEDLRLANEAADTERARLQLLIQKDELSNKATGTLIFNADILALLAKEESLIAVKRQNAAETMEQSAITQLEYDKIDLATRKELLGIDKQRLAISDQEHARRVADIQSDFTLSAGEKDIAIRAAARNREEVPKGPALNSVFDQVNSQWAALKTTMETGAQNFASLIVSPFKGLFDGLQSSIEGLIKGTMTWGKALLNIATNIVSSLVTSFAKMVAANITGMIKMALQWVWTHTVMKVVALATNAAVGASEKKSGLVSGFNLATKAAKSVADIPYVGWALAIAAFTGIMAMVIAASAIGGFEKGGFTGLGDPHQPAGIVHRGEYVMPAPAVQRLGVDTLDAMKGGQLPTSVTRGSSLAGSSGGSTKTLHQNLYVFHDKRQMLDALRDDIEGIALEVNRRATVRL